MQKKSKPVVAALVGLALLFSAWADNSAAGRVAARAAVPAIAWLVVLAISLAVSVVATLIMPKPKQPKPAAVKEPDSPTAEAGRPIPWVFGTMTIKSGNVLGFWDKSTRRYETKA